ncbi:M23 family metallopeptidase [Croceicoccus sp. Ery15]|uniref:M23 family metallopeptidase n=1 Tax=Croceicoccus sp. Ery15 TaxID=1703338 RepID=UPI001E30F220|nr:M23 family metallopeptidase [Croceicoccus sp. Ery15]
MLGSNRFFLPGTARFIALGTMAALSAAMTPVTALAQPGNNTTTIAATATEVASNSVSRDVKHADTSAEKADPRYRNLFARWKSVEVAQQVPEPVAGRQAVNIPSRMPLADARLSSNFGMRTHPVTGRRAGHKGIDLAAPSGTPIYATADGTIDMAQWFGGYGNFIKIEHGGDMETRYGHMSKLNVRAGQDVKKGDLIGFVGSTGRSTGPHLHYEVRIAGEAVDPTPYLHADTFMEAFASASENGAGGPE